jgi:hypothetical protein
VNKLAFLGTVAAVWLSVAVSATASPITPVQITDWPAPDVTSNGGNTAIASDPTSGNSVIVYGYTDGGVASYYTQLVNAAGNPVGPAHLLTANSRPFWAQPSIAWNPSTGGYLSCWPNYAGSSPVDIKCDALAADGTPAGSPSTINSTPDEYPMTNLAWSTAKGKFLVTMTDWADYARARFVDSSGAPSGSVIDFMPDSAYDFNGGAGLAYSPTSNRFLVYARAEKSSTEENAPWLWLLDGDGNPVGSPQRIDPDTAVEYKNASIVWNSVRDEFVVMSVNKKTDPEFYIRRFKAADGSPVGDPTTATVSSADFDPAWDRRFRPQLSAHAFADQMLAYVALDTNTAGGTTDYGIYSMSVAGDGTMGPPQPVAGGTSAYRTLTRPWLTFNPSSCEYLGDYSAKETAATDRHQLYTVRHTQPEPCKVDLTLRKAGAGSGSVSGNATESQMGLGSRAVTEGTTNLYRSYRVSLTAAAAPGSTFTGWSGACSGTGACEVAMSEARSVTANFSTKTPAKPGKVTMTSGDGKVTLSWQPPTGGDGGSPITGYTATATLQRQSGRAGRSCTVAASKRSCTITGLVNGRAYRVALTADNREGAGTPVVRIVTPRRAMAVLSTTRSGLSVVTRVRVREAGRLTQVGTVAGLGTRACRATSAVRRAGVVELRCALTPAALAALAERDLRVRVATRFAPAAGGQRSAVRRVAFARTDAADAVTG